MPNVILATALQWGYENSNRVVDSLSEDADIIITDGEFNVEKTIIGGKIKYEA